VTSPPDTYLLIDDPDRQQALVCLDDDLPVRRHADDVLAGVDEVARTRRQTFRRSERPELVHFLD